MRLLALFLVACGGGADAPAPEAPAPAAEPAPTAEAAPEAEAPEVEAEAPEAAAAAGDAVAAASDFDAAGAYAATCASCHGPAGAGDGPAGAALPQKPANFADAAFWSKYDDARVSKAIKEGGLAVGGSPLMAPFGALYDDGQIAALVALLKTFKK
jgi:mono/diheme cytochrome c family protein